MIGTSTDNESQMETFTHDRVAYEIIERKPAGNLAQAQLGQREYLIAKRPKGSRVSLFVVMRDGSVEFIAKR